MSVIVNLCMYMYMYYALPDWEYSIQWLSIQYVYFM